METHWHTDRATGVSISSSSEWEKRSISTSWDYLIKMKNEKSKKGEIANLTIRCFFWCNYLRFVKQLFSDLKELEINRFWESINLNKIFRCSFFGCFVCCCVIVSRNFWPLIWTVVLKQKVWSQAFVLLLDGMEESWIFHYVKLCSNCKILRKKLQRHHYRWNQIVKFLCHQRNVSWVQITIF